MNATEYKCSTDIEFNKEKKIHFRRCVQNVHNLMYFKL